MMTAAADPGPHRPAGAPPEQVATLYQFVRDRLEAKGGTATRAELLAAIRGNPAARAKLEGSRGFSALLSNMKHSGFIELDGETVRRTRRPVGRRRR